MKPSFLTLLCILLAASIACAQPAQHPVSYDPDDIGPANMEHKVGVRTCVQTGPAEVRMVFGSSVNPSSAAKPRSYRLMSETDPAFQNGVWASAAAIQSQDDVTYPEGWSGKKYPRYTVTAAFPQPMSEGHRYFVQILGAEGPVTGGRSAIWVGPDSPEVAAAAAENDLGIRHLEIVTPTLLLVATGDGVNTDLIDDKPANFIITSIDDPDFADGRPAARVGRRTQGDVMFTDGWPFRWFSKHKLFVILDKPLQHGKTYSIDLNAAAPITCGQNVASITIDDDSNVNRFIKVNQLGYLPAAPAKYAYVGAWMGTAGTLNLDQLANTPFEVRNADTGESVLSGRPTLRKRHEWTLVDGEIKGPEKAGETFHQKDLTYEDVWEMDLTRLTTPGSYYLVLPGMGRSLTFEVRPDIYAHAFDVAMIGLLHQRCGLEMKAPYSPFYRPACHRNMTELTTYDRRGTRDTNIWGVIANYVVPGAEKEDRYGGHHDAGDFNPRSHLDVAEQLLLAYDMAPNNFSDGQNRIPETGNGIPDIIDEARWQLDLWVRFQEPDGSVRGGAESDGDPDFVTPGDLDYKRDFVFAPCAEMSVRVAGAWALASEFYRKHGAAHDADDLLNRAVRAYDWAEANPVNSQRFQDAVALGSVLLYRATGNPKYRAAFEKVSVFNTKPNPDLDVYREYDQQLASYYYASCQRQVNPALRQKIVAAYRNRMNYWMRWADTTSYRWMRHPEAPNNWSSAALPKWCATPLQAYMLTGDRNYIKWVILTADYSLGVNPMNTVFMTRLGQRPISMPLHNNSRYNPNHPIPGTNSQGPSTPSILPEIGKTDSWPIEARFPQGPWPELLTYTDWCFTPSMNEATVGDQAVTAMVFGVLQNVPQPKLAPQPTRPAGGAR